MVRMTHINMTSMLGAVLTINTLFPVLVGDGLAVSLLSRFRRSEQRWTESLLGAQWLHATKRWCRVAAHFGLQGLVYAADVLRIDVFLPEIDMIVLSLAYTAFIGMQGILYPGPSPTADDLETVLATCNSLLVATIILSVSVAATSMVRTSALLLFRRVPVWLGFEFPAYGWLQSVVCGTALTAAATVYKYLGFKVTWQTLVLVSAYMYCCIWIIDSFRPSKIRKGGDVECIMRMESEMLDPLVAAADRSIESTESMSRPKPICGDGHEYVRQLITARKAQVRALRQIAWRDRYSWWRKYQPDQDLDRACRAIKRSDSADAGRPLYLSDMNAFEESSLGLPEQIIHGVDSLMPGHATAWDRIRRCHISDHHVYPSPDAEDRARLYQYWDSLRSRTKLDFGAAALECGV